MSSNLIRFRGPEGNGRPAPVDVALPHDAVEVSRPVNYRKAWQVLRERGWLIGLFAIAVALGTAYFLEKMPAKYTAKAVLQVELEEQKLIRTDESSGQDLRPSEVLNTIVQNIKNTSVLRRVVRNENLALDPEFLPGTHPRTELQLVRSLSTMVTAKLRQDTRLIDIAVTHRNAAIAERLANSVAHEFIRQNLDARFSTIQAANELLYAEAAKLKQKLELSEKHVQTYKEANETVPMEERQNIVVEKLQEINRRFTEAKAERLARESDFRQMQTLQDDPDAILLLPAVQQDPAVSDLRRKVVDAEARVATLALRYKPKYPKMMQAQRELDDLKQTLRNLASRVPQSVRSTYEAAVAREGSLYIALRDAQLESLNLDKKGIQYNVLHREVQSDRALYDSVLKRLKETDTSKNLERAAIAVVEPAVRPIAAIKFPTALTAAAAFFAAAFGAFTLLYLARITNTSIETVDQAESLLGLPVWAAIPVTKPRRKKLLPHVIAADPGSNCAESFRTLRTTASITAPAQEKKILMFTSADPSEGKSFCSVNHAICQAQEGKRTLLIDLDLRRPSLGESFSLPPETPGVTDYLRGKNSVAELARETPYANLFFLPAGPAIPHPSESLSNGAIARLVEEVTEDFDRVIIDTAPINAVSDAFLVLPLADVICLVVRSGRTPQRAVRRAIELMARAEVPPSGIVLNFLPARNGNGYYHYAPKYRYSKEVYGTNGSARVTTSS